MNSQNHIPFPFMKMHGLGNDFVVVDARSHAIEITEKMAQALGDRHQGVGFDQLAVIENARPESNADVHLTFYNSDGSTSAACGNATRCIARYLFNNTSKAQLNISTDRGALVAIDQGDGMTSVNMGPPQLNWDEIPLAHEMDTLSLPIAGAPVATGMGNPHATFFVPDISQVDLEARGSEIENHPLFPQRTNVQFAQIIGENHIRMRVWERGVGVTLASGSSSCATAVAAARRGLTGRAVRIDLDGGRLDIDWREDGVWMTGASMHVFSGSLTQEFLDSLR